MGCCNSRQDYYSILGITEEASKEDIKIGYSQVTSQPNITNEENREYLNKCTEAYFVLSDPEKKRNYDDFLEGKIETFDSGYSDENTIDIYNSFQKEMEKKEKLEKLEKEFNNKKEMLKKERKNLGIERKKSFLPNYIAKDITLIDIPEDKNYCFKNVSTNIHGNQINLKILHIKDNDNNIIHHIFEHSKGKINYYILDEDNGKNNEKSIKSLKEEKDMINMLTNKIQ